MATVETTINRPFGIVLWEPVFQDETLTSGDAATWPAGTLLGRVTADGDLVPYASDAVDGSEVPVAVLAYDVTFDAAGSKSERPLISGRVRLNDLSVFGSETAVSKAESDQLRGFGIIAQDVTQLGQLDE